MHSPSAKEIPLDDDDRLGDLYRSRAHTGSVFRGQKREVPHTDGSLWDGVFVCAYVRACAVD